MASSNRKRTVAIALAIVGIAALIGGFSYLDYKLLTRGSDEPVAARAPEFDLPDQGGNRVSLTSLRTNGAAVLVFYRGHW